MREGSELAYAIRDTDLGRLLVAATSQGVCLVRFGATDSELAGLLRRELPFAVVRREGGAVAEWADAIVAYVDGRASGVEVPLDVRGSCFQRRVWKELAAIPRGETRSYREVARALGMERGARAVARACAANPVPVVVPCHRVIASSGVPGGYNGGGERKLRLLRGEGVDLPGVAAGVPRARSAVRCGAV